MVATAGLSTDYFGIVEDPAFDYSGPAGIFIS